MFARLFAESGLSLDRLRALVEVGATGSIAQAAGGDPVRQSQYSRQIKELEDFFRIPLIERHGKGVRFTSHGKELARISRFLLMGLSNFQRGCLGEEKTYHIGASATFIHIFLWPLLINRQTVLSGIPYAVAALPDDVIERRLHELTLDFAIITGTALSRPLQSKRLRSWKLVVMAPNKSRMPRRQIARAFHGRKLPFVLPAEVPGLLFPELAELHPALICNNFLEAKSAALNENLAAVLPDYLLHDIDDRNFVTFPLTTRHGKSDAASHDSKEARARFQPHAFQYSLAWNPRLLRLNPQAGHRRDALLKDLLATTGSQPRPLF